MPTDPDPDSPPPPRTFTLNDPYALEALCHRERSMLPRLPRRWKPIHFAPLSP